MIKLFNIIFLLFSSSLFAQYNQSFVIKISPQVIKVTSPKSFNKNLSVVVENNSMVKVLGKIETEDGSYEKIVAIKPREFTSVNLNINKNKKLFFVPISPPFQRIKLLVGQRDYEIPTKK